jgi:hypothetical protein
MKVSTNVLVIGKDELNQASRGKQIDMITISDVSDYAELNTYSVVLYINDKMQTKILKKIGTVIEAKLDSSEH